MTVTEVEAEVEAATLRAPARRVRRPDRALLATATATITAAVLAVGPVAAPAQAQDSSGPLGAVAMQSVSPLVLPGNLPGSSGSSILAVADSLGVSPAMFAGPPPPAPQPDPTITTTRVVGKEVDRRYERWFIDSADMQRRITVEVYRAPGGNPDAPFLYLLDGVGSELPSGFMHWGAAQQFADQDVNLVIPTGGQGSMWADWNEPDPVLGVNAWERFITRDLPTLVEPQVSTSSNRAIGGISMGAGAAVTLAARHPGLYRGVFGVSGCYSTDARGQLLTRYTVESRGGTLSNMWGEPGNAQWAAHDAMIHAEALRGMAIYLSSGSGVAAPGDWERYGLDVGAFVADMAVEQATGQCTRAAERRLQELGIPATIDHLPTGLHNWSYYSRQIPVAWSAIRDAL